MGKMSTRMVYAPAVKHQIETCCTADVFHDGGVCFAIDWGGGVLVASGADTAVIQAAITYVGLGGKVFIHVDIYIITAMLTTAGAGMIFQGEGMGTVGGQGTILRCGTNLNNYILDVLHTDTCIRDLYFDGNKGNQTGGGGVLLCRAMDCSVHNVAIMYAYAYGLNLQSYHCDLQNVYVEHSDGTGVRVTGNSHCFKHVVSWNNGLSGFEINTCVWIIMIGCVAARNQRHGYLLSRARYCIISTCTTSDNSRETTNTYDGWHLEGAAPYSIYNIIISCQAIHTGDYAEFHRYDIYEDDANQDYNMYFHNFLRNNATAPARLLGLNDFLPTVVFPFVDGSDPQDSGFLIDAAGEFARAYGYLPFEVQQVVRVRVHARPVITNVNGMYARYTLWAAAVGENYQTHGGTPLDVLTAAVTADVIISWIMPSTPWLALLGGDSFELKVEHHIGTDTEHTNAYFRTVTFEYV